ncbi:rhodanese-like domain-containing protein [Endothiovibrio diazotrophicus]
MKTFNKLVEECLKEGVNELFPWDLTEFLEAHPETLLVDIREPYEYNAMHMAGAINVPRGILESACEFNYEETVPALADARDQPVVLLCRSGNRTVLAASVMQRMGYRQVYSLKTGLRGWNDFEQPLVDHHGQAVDIDTADDYFTTHLRPEQAR